MNLDHLQAQPQYLLDIGQDVSGVARMQAAAR